MGGDNLVYQFLSIGLVLVGLGIVAVIIVEKERQANSYGGTVNSQLQQQISQAQAMAVWNTLTTSQWDGYIVVKNGNGFNGMSISGMWDNMWNFFAVNVQGALQGMQNNGGSADTIQDGSIIVTQGSVYLAYMTQEEYATFRSAVASAQAQGGQQEAGVIESLINTVVTTAGGQAVFNANANNNIKVTLAEKVGPRSMSVDALSTWQFLVNFVANYNRPGYYLIVIVGKANNQIAWATVSATSYNPQTA